jgi:hypothetical protein
MTNLQIKIEPMSMTVDISSLMTLPQMSELRSRITKIDAANGQNLVALVDRLSHSSI